MGANSRLGAYSNKYGLPKKVFTGKLISVLFEILKDKDDDLDETMITREINREIVNLSFFHRLH